MLSWDFQREDIERAVRRQLGMKSVINCMTLRPRVFPRDTKRWIQSALVRSALLDAKRISVEAHDGAVMLEGKVKSWAERDEAQRTAWAAPGVLQVKNNISISAA